MAKRFTISLPDELAHRFEPFKDQLSLSAIMQKSLEAELAELIRPEEEKAKDRALLKLAEAFFKESFSNLVNAATVFVDYLIEKAIQDADLYIFKLYGHLQAIEMQPDTPLSIVQGLEERIQEFFDDDTRRADQERSRIEGSSALLTFWHMDPEVIREEYPEDRPWNECDFLRVMRIVLYEKLQSMLGEEAIKTYLTWHSGFPDPWVQREQNALRQRGEEG